TAAAAQRVAVRGLGPCGPLEIDLRRPAVGADDRLDLRVAFEALGEAAAPVGRQTRDEHPFRAHPNHTLLRLPTMSNSSSWIVARTSWATVWTSALSSHGASPMSSVRTGA